MSWTLPHFPVKILLGQCGGKLSAMDPAAISSRDHKAVPSRLGHFVCSPSVPASRKAITNPMDAIMSSDYLYSSSRMRSGKTLRSPYITLWLKLPKMYWQRPSDLKTVSQMNPAIDLGTGTAPSISTAHPRTWIGPFACTSRRNKRLRESHAMWRQRSQICPLIGPILRISRCRVWIMWIYPSASPHNNCKCRIEFGDK